MEQEPVTYEKILKLIAETWEIFRQNQLQQQAMLKRIQEERELERLRLEEERLRFEEERKQREEERERERLRLEEERLRFEEERKQREEERKQREEERKQREEEDRKRREEWEKKLAATNKKIADFTDTLGLFAEEQVAPAALRLFDNMPGLREVMRRVVIQNERREPVGEVDLLLVNGDSSVAIEVKNRLRKDDIDEHLERLSLMQKYPSRAFAQTRVYGAVAAMIADKSLIDYALKKGLYVIVPSGESVDLVQSPGFVPRYWDVGPRLHL
ncbi:MAG: hypothetical protein NZ534_04750 [Bacteroidia bacterium]|nr:hypothetical protein [Bacteroidia bacterium]